MAVNQQPALRGVLVTSEPRQGPRDEQAEGRFRKGKSRDQTGKSEPEGRSKETKSKERANKRESEMVRRGAERHELERMCSLFKAPRNGWTRKEALSLGEINFLIDGIDEPFTNFDPVVLFRLYGPEAFPPGFVVVRSTAPRL